MSDRGIVVAVTIRNAGSELVGAHASGVSVLQVYDPYQFSEAPGGELQIGDDVYSYTGFEDETSTINLTGPTSAAYADGELVYALPLTPEKTATIVLGDDGASIDVRVPHALDALMPEGIREVEEQESVAIEFDGDEYVILDVLGRAPVMDGAVIDPETTIPEEALTDGEPPAASPDCTTLSQLRGVFVNFPPIPNRDLVTYEIHVKDGSFTGPGAKPVAGDPATLVAETKSTLILVRTLADGTPMVYDVDYNFCVIARDNDGPAEPGDVAMGHMDRAGTGDIVVGSVTTELLDSVVAIVGLLQIGGGLIEASPPGGVFPDLTGGIVVKNPADPDGEPLVRLHPLGCTFRGKVTTDILTVLQDLVVNGDVEFASGGEAVMKNGVSDPPVGPDLAQGSLTGLATWPGLPAGHSRRGICWDATGGQWVELLTRNSDKLTRYRTVSTSGTAGTVTTFASSLTNTGLTGVTFSRVSGVAVMGTSIYTAAVYVDSGLNEFTVVHKSVLSTGARTTEALADISGAGSDPAIGTDGTSVYVYLYAVFTPGHTVIKYDSSLAQLGTALLTGYGDHNNRFVTVGDLGYGASKLTIAHDDQVEVFALPAFNGSAVAKDAALSWTMDASITNGGLAYKSSGGDQGFYSNHSDGKLSRWSSYYPSAGEKFWVKYVDTGGGNHTGPSLTTTSIAVGKRRFAVATLRDAPDGVTGADTFVGYGSSLPGTYYKRSETLSVSRVLVMTAGKDTSGTTTVPATNTLGGTPFVFRSEVGDLEMDGAGNLSAPKQDQRIVPTLQNGTGTGEVIVAQWDLPADYLIDDVMYQIAMLADVSGTATLTWRIRCGTAGTTADSTIKTFTTTGAGAANVLATNDFKLSCLADGVSGLLAAAGFAMLGGAIVGPTSGGGAGVGVNTTVPLKLSVTLTQSASQTTTIRSAVLNRLRG